MKLVKTTCKVIISVRQDITYCIERKMNYTSQGAFYIAYEEMAPKGSQVQTRTLSHHTHTICNVIQRELLYCFRTGSMHCDIPCSVCLPVKICQQLWWRRWIARLGQKRGKGVLPAGCEWLLVICCWEIPHCAGKAVGRFRYSNYLKPELALFKM